MESDIDADVTWIKTPTKFVTKNSTHTNYSAGNETNNNNNNDNINYLMPPDESMTQNRNAISPVSNYSVKSIKDSLDVTKIRSILSRLKAELEEEKKRNHNLIVRNEQQLKNQKIELETKLNKSSHALKESFDKKCEQIEKTKDIEIKKLNKKLTYLTNINDNTEASELITKMEKLLSTLNDPDKLKIGNILTLVAELKILIKKISEELEQSNNKLVRMKKYNADLTGIIRMLDSKLKSEKNQDKESKNNNNDSLDVEELLRIATNERLQLERQIVWLKTQAPENKDPTHTELFHTDSIPEKENMNTTEKLLKKKVYDNASINASMDENTENLKEKVRELEKLCKQQQLNYEEALLELETMKKTNQRMNTDYAKYIEQNDLSIPSQSGIEKDRTIQNSYSTQINEEALSLDMKRNVSGNNQANETISKSGTNDGRAKGNKVPPPTNIRVETQRTAAGSSSGGSGNSTTVYVIKWTPPTNCETKLTGFHVYLDGHFYQPVSINEQPLVSIPKSECQRRGLTPHRVSVRSVGLQGQSKDAQCTLILQPPVENANLSNMVSYAPSGLKATKITCASAQLSWVPADSNLQHSVWLNGSKYCDIPVGSYKVDLENLSPNSLQRISVCPYIDRFGDNSLHAAQIDFQTLPMFTESINFLSKNPQEELQCPKDVKLKLGSRPGKFVVKWQCPPAPTSDNIKIIGYALFISNQCISSVNGAKSDRISVNLNELQIISPPPFTPRGPGDQPHLSLAVRTVANYIAASAAAAAAAVTSISSSSTTGAVATTAAAVSVNEPSIGTHEVRITSRDSTPVLRFSGHVAARIAGTAAEAAILLGDHLAVFLHLIEPGSFENVNGGGANFSKRSRTPKHGGYDLRQSKMSVPKIQITKDSSFSEDDENLSRSSYSIRGASDSGEIHHSRQNDNRSDRMNNPNYYEYQQQQQHHQPHHPQQQHKSQKLPQHMARTRSGSSPTQSQSQPPPPSLPLVASQQHPNSRMPPPPDTSNSNMPNSNHQRVGAIVSATAATADNSVPYGHGQYDNDTGNRPPHEYNVRYFIALYDYDPITMSPNPGAVHEELPFKTGQTVKVFGDIDEDGFFTGETNGRRGLVPSNMVREMENINNFRSLDDGYMNSYGYQDDYIRKEPTSQHQHQLPHQQQPQLSQPQPQPQLQQQQQPHQQYNQQAPPIPSSAPYNYSAANNRRPLPNQQSASLLSNHPSKSPSGYRKMIAMYDYDPQVLSPNVDSEAELAFRSGDVILILGDMDEDGFYMGDLDGQRGLVPSNFLADMDGGKIDTAGGPPPPQPPQPPPQQSQHQPLPPLQQQSGQSYRDSSFDSDNQYRHASSDVPPIRDNRHRYRGESIDSGRPGNGRSNYGGPAPPQASQMQQRHHQQQPKPTSSFDESFDSGGNVDKNRHNYTNQSKNTSSTYYDNSNQPRRYSQQLPLNQSQSDAGSLNNNTNTNTNPRYSGQAGVTPSLDNSLIPVNKETHNRHIHQTPPQASTIPHQQMQHPQQPQQQQQHPQQPPQQQQHQRQQKHQPSAAETVSDNVIQIDQDDMPIVMDLGPPNSRDHHGHHGHGHNQKKKKYSPSLSESYRSESTENYVNQDGSAVTAAGGGGAGQYLNTSENLERKRSVFKNPFKKKKS